MVINENAPQIVRDEIKRLDVPQEKLSAFLSDFYTRHGELREKNAPAFLSLLFINIYHAGMKAGGVQ